jgi:hypothetical protein
MTETLPGSNPQMLDTTAPTPGTTPNSADSIVALPNLRESKAPISLTLSIDKSVGKVAAWIVGVMTIAIVVAIASMVTAKSAYDRADSADSRAEDMRAYSDARFEELSTKFSIVERENRVTQERWNDLKVELAKRGIPVSDH